MAEMGEMEREVHQEPEERWGHQDPRDQQEREDHRELLDLRELLVPWVFPDHRECLAIVHRRMLGGAGPLVL